MKQCSVRKIVKFLINILAGAAVLLLLFTLSVSAGLLWYRSQDDRKGEEEYRLIRKIAKAQEAEKDRFPINCRLRPDMSGPGAFDPLWRLAYLESGRPPAALAGDTAGRFSYGIYNGAFEDSEDGSGDISSGGSGSFLPLPDIDGAALYRVNSDYAAWLYIPGTDVDYPVVFPKTNGDYLRTTFKKTSRACGCLFFESSYPPFSGFNTVIYGHNMRSGEMFGGLKQYLDKTYLEEHGAVYLCCGSAWRRYEVVSVFLTDNSDMSPYQPEGPVLPVYPERADSRPEGDGRFAPAARFSGNIPKRVCAPKKFLTLSTCHGKSQKLIVQAELAQIRPFV